MPSLYLCFLIENLLYRINHDFLLFRFVKIQFIHNPLLQG
ncbi:hypothetical protein BPUTEOMOX_23 [methanotrophic endosymbiont of Bathymodiolus puteoserpentis (Logatchev)]|nr:hypothetical protein BPUTEOMOX_23 [methanotrophic endosymbiont of Bathymodiolus puteoserpentis (Logatchev)]